MGITNGERPPCCSCPPHLANFVCSPGQWCTQNSERVEHPCHIQMMAWALGNGEWPPCHHCPLTMLTSFAAQDGGAHRIPNEQKAHAMYSPCHILPTHAMYRPCHVLPMPHTTHATYVCSPGQQHTQDRERAEPPPMSIAPMPVRGMGTVGNGEWPPCRHHPPMSLTLFAAPGTMGYPGWQMSVSVPMPNIHITHTYIYISTI